YNGGQPFRFEATGGFVTGADSYLWTIIGGAFPPGLSLNPLTGEVSGIPTTAGSYVFTLRASDGAFPPGTAQNVFTINISPLVALPMFISTNATLPIGDEGNPYFY